MADTTEIKNWQLVLLAIALLASIGLNIYWWLEQEGIRLPDASLYESKSLPVSDTLARIIKPCIYEYDMSGAYRLDSCWGDSVAGGTISTSTLLQLFLENPDSVNCISYSFGIDRKADAPRFKNKLFLILHGNHVEVKDGVCKITKVSGNSYPVDWLCPTECPTLE